MERTAEPLFSGSVIQEILESSVVRQNRRELLLHHHRGCDLPTNESVREDNDNASRVGTAHEKVRLSTQFRRYNAVFSLFIHTSLSYTPNLVFLPVRVIKPITSLNVLRCRCKGCQIADANARNP